jgi:hypothetical protein
MAARIACIFHSFTYRTLSCPQVGPLTLRALTHKHTHAPRNDTTAGEWTPGGEYIQKLTVKNVSGDLKKLKYRLPTSRFFSMAYPELITLSPGMEVVVDVVFRPVVEEVRAITDCARVTVRK